MHAFSVVLFCFSWLFYEQDYLLSFSNVVVDDKISGCICHIQMRCLNSFRKLFFLGSLEDKRILPGNSSGIERLP